MRPLARGTVKDEVTHFFLVKETEKAATLSAAARKEDIDRINKVVKREGGLCRLYSTKAAPYDYMSVITGLTAAAAVRIVAEMESRGIVKATLVSGMELFSTPQSRETREEVSSRALPVRSTEVAARTH